MKKLLATILALVMALSFCTLVWADTCDKGDSCAEHMVKIGNEHYKSLTAAVEAVKSGETITMLQNYADNGIQVKSGKNFTVDFAGHILTLANPLVGSAGTETNGFQLLEGSTITLKNGTIRSEEAYILIQNYSNLTLENMTLDGSKIPVHKTAPSTVRYTLSNNSGTIIINNSTIIAPETLGVAFDVCRYARYTGPSVTVKGDSAINGRVEISSSGNKEGAVHKLIVESGTFNGDISAVGSNPNFEASITGGTFSSNPSIYVHDTNYRVVKEGDAKYVVAAKGDNTTSEVVLPAASNGATVIPKSDVDANKGLVVKSDTATVEFNQAAVRSIGMADAETTLTVENITESAGTASSETKAAYDKAVAGKDKSSVLVLEMNLKRGNEIITYIPGDGGAVIVTVPYKTNQKNVQVFYLNTVEGKAEELTKVDGPALSANQFYYNSTTGEVTMMLPHFSSYLIASDSQSSSSYYYKTPSTTTPDTTKGSPKTFDAGVGIYAVTALLSVTGMAWAGKKRH